jgi:23S rRNA (cytosine1962-C5)-methyltransferase
MQLESLLATAFAARSAWLNAKHESAVRLFNGHLEGEAGLVVDLYGKTVVLQTDGELDGELPAFIHTTYPWVNTIVHKNRKAKTDEAKRGQVVSGDKPDTWVREHEVRYAIDLTLNQDASFYLDTAQLRQWLLDNMRDKTVLNTFAYTGSLGVAAMAGGAKRVVHADLNKRFLNVAKTSYTLNGFPIQKKDFQVGDFWSHMNKLKRQGERFDCVILDPPFFSATAGGTVDLAQNMTQLINKVRPLVIDGGRIVAISNALYVSGADYMAELEALGKDGYVVVEKVVKVPAFSTGYPHTATMPPITDPAPFNHSTKIAVLRVRHKN